MINLDKKYIAVCLVLVFLLSFHLLPKVKERLFFFSIGKSYSNDSEWKNVNTIREWVSTHTPSSSDNLIIQDKLWKNSPYEMYLKFSLQQGGVNCAGYSYALMKLYREFGYKAFSYHSGRLDAFNHVITLVEITYKGEKRLVIEDATFDATYIDDNMDPYDFFTFLELLQKKRYTSIHIIQSNSPPHLYICDRSQVNNCRTNSKKNGPTIIRENVETYYEKYGTNTIEHNKHIYLYPRIIQTSDDLSFPLEDVDSLKKFLRKML